MPLASWLFIKQEQSIWVERPYGCSLIIAGPGSTREQHDFPDEGALDAYQISLAERLSEGGWFLWGLDRERRSGRERRAIPSRSPDRRQSMRR
jgi:hypothetical protein